MPRNELIRITPAKQPSRIARWFDVVRSYTMPPLTSKSPELARYFGGTPVSSGVAVNENTAMDYSAVWAAVALISDDIASLPLVLYKNLPNGGKDKFEDHPLYELLHDAPNPEMSSFVWRRTMQSHLSLWQNAYAEIERDMAGRPVAIWPLVPERVQKFRQNGLVKYRYQNPDASEVIYGDRDMLHLVGHSHDGSVGSSLVMHARESIGLALAAEKFGGSFFGNGSTFGGVISYKGPRPNEMSDKNYTDALAARHQGVERAHKLLRLYNDATFTTVGVEPNKAQFLETRVFQIREVARWFKIPPHKLGDLADATFSNVEQQNTDYFTSCLRPLCRLWEQELKRKLISRPERKIQNIRHVTQDFLAADAAGRSALYTAEFNVGAITPNEVRQFEGLDPIAGGDRAFVQLNMIPLDKVDAWVEAQIEKMKAPPAPKEPPPAKTQDAADEIKALREALELSRHATQLAEDARDLAQAATAAEKQYRADTEALLAQAQEAERSLAVEARHEQNLRVAGETRETVLIAERDAALARVVEGGQSMETIRQMAAAEREEWQRDLAAVTTERDALAVERDIFAANCARALESVTRAEGERDAARLQASSFHETAVAAEAFAGEAKAEAIAADGRAVLAFSERDALAAEAEALKTDVARARADIAAELDKQKTQRSVLLAAMRSLFVDASERLIYREAERARKNQGTADKLKAWADRFYPMHAEHVRATFQPLVGPWTAITGGAPGVLLDRLVSEHIEASTRSLALVADADDPDEMAAQLERTLGRWESERADAMADALVREGMAR